MRIGLASNDGGIEGVALFGALLDSRHSVAAVLQEGDPRLSIAHGRDTNLLLLAHESGVPSLAFDQVGALSLDLILISNFGAILSAPLIAVPRIGCINIHPSLLPRHRGRHPIAHALLHADEETGVTFHAVEPRVDSGPILLQSSLPIGPRETSVSLRSRCSELAVQHVVSLLDRVEHQGELAGTPQDEATATSDPPITQERAEVDWALPAATIERCVRAFVGCQPAWFGYDGERVLLYEVRVEPLSAPGTPGEIIREGAQPVFATGREGLVVIDAEYAPVGPPGAIVQRRPWPAC